MIVPFVDLKAQYRAIAAEGEQAIHRVVADTDFILGADVELFERGRSDKIPEAPQFSIPI